MGRRKKATEGHVDETWLIPYSDLLTLLLALFIVLFAASSIDKEKYQEIMQVFYNSFRPTQTVTSGELYPEGVDIMTIPPSGEMEGQKGTEQLSTLFNTIAAYIDANGLADKISLKLQDDFLLLTLTSDVLFASGSAEISAAQSDIAQKLGAMIAASYTQKMEIIITGHTDNVPMSSAQYKSNWFLSAVRALNFMEAMLENSTLEPQVFSARGYGEFSPIASNDTAEGRMLNRRVEVLVTVPSD